MWGFENTLIQKMGVNIIGNKFFDYYQLNSEVNHYRYINFYQLLPAEKCF